MKDLLGWKPMSAIESSSPKSPNRTVAFLDRVIPAPNSVIESDLSNKFTSIPCLLRA